MNYSDKFGATSFQEVSSPFAKGDFDILIPGNAAAQPTPSGFIKITDAELLFSGNYKREGSDLVISNDVRKLVVPDYFKGEVRPTLSSRDGATLSGHVIEALTGHVSYAQASGAPEPPKEIGSVAKLTGSATAIRNGVAVELNIGDKVYKGDVLQSGQGASLGITFIDGTAFSLSSNARMVLNEMVYDPNGSSNSSLLSLVQGTITFVAGQTAKNGNMRVDTPVATMGIRGTAVLVEIGADNGPTKFSVLVEPGNKVGSFNLYDKATGALLGSVSQAGQVTLVTPGGIGQQATAVELPKTVIDLQNERSLIKQVFEMFFPNYNDANPQGTKGIGSSVNNLANYLNGLIKVDPGTTLFKQDVNFLGLSGPVTVTATAVTTPPPIIITDATDIQPPEERGGRFTIADQIAPDSRIIPYIAGSGKLDTAEGPGSMPSGFPLRSLVSLNPQTGEITYNPADFRFLADGEQAIYTFSFQSQSDEFIFTKTLTLTIDGLNDAPIFTVENFAAPVAEPGSTDSAATFSKQGTLTFTDLDFSDVASGYTVQTLGVTATGTTTAVPNTTALLGFLNLNGVTKAVGSTQGVITQTFSAPASAFDYLAAGETVNLAYQISVTDADGASRTSTLTVTVTGTNDTPTITGATTPASTSGDLLEDGMLTASGVITFRDVDLSNTHTAVSALTGGTISTPLPGFNPATSMLGSLVVTVNENPNDANNIGTVSWVYSLDNLIAQRLAEGQVVTQTFTVTITDSSGATVTQPVTVTITGANDVPEIVLSSPNVGDPVTIDTGAVTEEADVDIDGDISTAGIVVFKDVDLSDTHTASAVLKSADATDDLPGFSEGVVGVAASVDSVGTFTLDTGLIGDNTDLIDIGVVGWTFTVDNDHPVVQSLAAGQTITQVYTITITDSSGAAVTKDVTVTITGTNDAPTVDAAVVEILGEPTDASALSASIAVDFGDVDLIDTGHSATILGVSPTGPLGGLSEGDLLALVSPGTVTKASGSQTGTFDLNFSAPAGTFDYLADGETLTLVYGVQIDDGDGGKVNQTVSITITGSNDAPTIAAVADTELADASGSALTIDASIEVTFDDVDATDTGHSVAITAVAASDATAGLLLDDEQLIDLLTLQSLSSPAGSGVGTANFAFSAPSAAFDYLAVNETLTLTYTVSVSDGDVTVTQDFVVTITGTNDAPVITSNGGEPLTVAVAENTAEVTTVIAADIDNGATVTYSIVTGAGSPDAALFEIDPNTGVLSFIAPPDYEAPPGAGPYVVQVRASDGTDEDIQTITVDVTDVQEGPAGNDIVAALENTPAGLTQLSLNDQPGHNILAVHDEQHGTAVIGSGNVTFLPDTDFSGIASFQYDVSDNGDTVTGTATVTVNVAPLAATPTFVTGSSASGNEDTAISLGTINAVVADADGSESLVLKLSGFPTGATFRVDGELVGALATAGPDAGKWIIDDPSAIELLASSALTVTPPANFNGNFTLTVDAVVTDTAMLTTGIATDTKTFGSSVNVSVNPENDAPVVTFASFSVDEGGTTVLSASDIVVSDLDNTSHAFTVSDVEHGVFQRWVEGDFWEDVTEFTSAQLDIGMIRFVHDGSENAPGFSIQADDGAAVSDEFSGSIDYTPVNDAPTITVDQELSRTGAVTPAQTVQLENLDITGEQQVTVEFWYNHADTVPSSMLFGFDIYDLFVGLIGSNGVRGFGFNTGNGDLYGIPIPTNLTGEWHHIAAVFDATNVFNSKLYIDGDAQTLSLITSNPPNQNNVGFTDNPRIGGWNNDNVYSFDGQIDDFRLWQGERSEAEIQQNMHGELQGPQPTLVASYSFDDAAEGPGGVIDTSGNGHHATLVGLSNNLVSSAVSVDEDAQLVFSVANGNAITVGDVDGDDLVLEISVSYGTLTYNSSDGVVSLSGDLPIRVEGSAAVINAFLDGLVYQGGDNFNGQDTLSIVVSDDSLNTVVEKQIPINVHPVNDAPVVQSGAVLNFPAGSAPDEVDPLLSLSDVDSPTLTGAVIKFESGYTGTESLGAAASLMALYGLSQLYSNGVLTISGTSTVAHYQEVLQSVHYANGAAGAGERVISFQVDDGEELSNAATATVNVQETANNPPVAGDDQLYVRADFSGIISNLTYNDSDPDNDAVTISDASHGATQATAISGGFAIEGLYGTLYLYSGQALSPFDTLVNPGDYAFVVGKDADGEPIPGISILDLQPDETLSDAFTYTISDGNGGFDTATINLTVQASPAHVDVHTPFGYDTTTLSSDLFEGSVFSIDEEDGVVLHNGTRTIIVETKDLTFSPLGGNDYELTGGLIKGFTVINTSTGEVLFTADHYSIPATVMNGALADSAAAFDVIFQTYAYQTNGSVGADVLRGGDRADVIDTGGGADDVMAGGGNDVILVHDDSGWNIDGGDGIDTVRAAGSFVTGQGQDMGSELSNVEIIDLNSDGVAGAVSLLVDAEGAFNVNATHTGRILGDEFDTVNFDNYFEGHPTGMWIAGDQHVEFNPDNATPGVYFDQYFYRDGAQTLATVYVHEDINVAPIVNFDSIVVAASAFQISGGNATLQIDNSLILQNDVDVDGELNVHDYPDIPQAPMFQFHGEASGNGGFTDYTLSTSLMPGGALNESLIVNDGFFYRAIDDATGSVSGPQAVNMVVSGLTHPSGAYIVPGSPLNDVIIGGNTADQFVFAGNTGSDVIINFQQGIDMINFQNYGPAISQDNIDDWLDDHAAPSGLDTLITFDANNSILVKNTALTANDFILHPGGGGNPYA